MYKHRITFKTKKNLNTQASNIILTRSSAEPPPRYSIIIHNLVSYKNKKREITLKMSKARKKNKL